MNGVAVPGSTRLFDFVDVPSPFIGTKFSIRPRFKRPQARTRRRSLRSFNSMSQFRDPGLINLNTTTDLRVFNGMLGSLSFDPTIDNSSYWNVLQQSLRVPGFDVTTNSASNPNHLNSDPTQFMAPFKSATNAGFATDHQRPAIADDDTCAMQVCCGGLPVRFYRPSRFRRSPAYDDATRNPTLSLQRYQSPGIDVDDAFKCLRGLGDGWLF